MSPSEIIIPVRLDARTFKRFSRFDALRLRRRWVRPLAFAAIFSAFAIVALLSRRPESGLIAGVLFAVGLGLPLAYFGTFFAQVNRQAAQRGLDRPRRVYTVRLDFDGVRATNDQRREDAQSVRWQDAFAAFRVPGCIYLYVSPQRAYLLPDGQANVDDDALWAYIREHMGEKCQRYRGKD